MVAFVLFFVLAMASTFTMTRAYERALRVHEESVSTQREFLKSMQGAEDQDLQFHDLVVTDHTVILGDGVYSHRAPRPLGVLVTGLERRVPSQVNASFRGVREVEEKRYENPLFQLFASPDYVHIVNVVVSLLSLLFVFDAICGEKESGTLKILLSNSVPRDLVLLGKWIGGYLSLSVPLSVWICWILVIPNLAPMIARIAAPVPTLQKISAEKAAIDRETEARTERVQRSMLGYGKRAAQLREVLRQEASNRKAKIDDYYEEVLQDQIDWSRNLSRISPSGSFLLATTDLAGTGFELFTGFQRDFRRFGDEFLEWGNAWDDAYHDNGGKHPDAGWFQLESIPALSLNQPRLDDAVEAVLLDMLLLLVFNVLFFLLSYLFFLRYDVT